jgi:RES domain
VVEAQFRNSTRKLVDSDAEQELLEQLIDERAKLPVPDGFERLHYLLYTPFRHPPLRNGSRFGTRLMRGILYGARELPTAFAEVAYYRLVFLDGPAVDLGDLHLELTAFWFGILAPHGVDLCVAPFRAFEGQISSKTRYEASQRLGADMRAAGVQCCLFTSARAEGGQVNLAVFDNVFRPNKPLREEPWTCRATRASVDFRSRTLLGPERRHAFSRAQFEVAGRLPAPALA